MSGFNEILSLLVCLRPVVGLVVWTAVPKLQLRRLPQEIDLS